jgi:hypothetical protein
MSVLKAIHKYLRFIVLLAVLAVIFFSIFSEDFELVGQQGFVLILASILGYFIYEFMGLYIDYLLHRKPLLAVDPDVHYPLRHHVKQVTLPLIRYRTSGLFSKPKKQSTN